jgi:hypothetical protein
VSIENENETGKNNSRARLQRRDVGTGTSDIFSLNDDRSHSLFGQSPGEVLTCFAAAQHDDIARVGHSWNVGYLLTFALSASAWK